MWYTRSAVKKAAPGLDVSGDQRTTAMGNPRPSTEPRVFMLPYKLNRSTYMEAVMAFFFLEERESKMNAAVGQHNENERLATGMRRISRMMLEHDDRSHADKVEELIGLSGDGKLYVAVCGHFSAGKSSLINLLCGHALLPSGPIPTSANMVLIENGPASAHVRFNADGGSEQGESVALDQLEALCADGGRVRSVRIAYPVDLLGDELALLDTPGIDSTDEAHLQSTESALHLADVIFYVMDYNHVQSEINFEFCKRLMQWGKPVYLIINQVDKHREQELSFAAYRERVIQSFGDWGLEPTGFLFVSVRHPRHPLNEWTKLQWLIGELKRNMRPFKQESLNRSCRMLVQSHVRLVSSRRQEAKERLSRQSDNAAFDELARTEEQWNAEGQRLAELAGHAPDEWKRDIGVLIENANIIPAVTRDLAGQYLQSLRPGFKVGLIFAASKTAMERNRRLQRFHAHFAEQIQTHLEKHLRDLFRESAQRYGLQAERWRDVPDRLNLAPAADWLGQKVQKGTVFSDEYTMVYCKQCSGEVKTLYRHAALDIAGRMAEELAQAAAARQTELQADLRRLKEQAAAARALDDIRQSEREYEQQLLGALPSRRDAGWPAWPVPDAAPAAMLSASAPDALFERGAEPAAAGKRDGASVGKDGGAASAEKRDGIAMAGSSALLSPDEVRPLTETADKLTRAVGLLDDLPGFRSVVESMREKAERLKENRFTIALFGAFSAGKSSFANALIGEAALPVSPNPTTAAINQVMPARPGRPHRTAVVKFKSVESMGEDIEFSLRAIGMDSSGTDSNPERLLERIGSIDPQRVPSKGKPHLAFLKAVKQGWSDAWDQLGAEIQVGYDRFVEYAADEAKSCFVERIEFYYDCPFTSRGMTLVDTPGADSIHARHTGVAFDYIKNADAVLFVTYYNHAFSQADREFLRQLGRVKDNFALDKMFFIVNAADLASSPVELQQVMQHVEQHLLSFGIRRPRIYPISSLKALREKQGFGAGEAARSGIREFELNFVRFCYRELAAMTVRAAELDLLRSVEGLVSLTEEAHKGEEERKREMLRIRESSDSALAWLQKARAQDDVERLRHEINELIYYVRQRLSFRCGEFYNLAFHPSQLREDKGDLRMALRAARHELIRLIAYDLSQEMLATTLRIETFIQRRAGEWAEQLGGAIAARFPGFRPAPFREKPIGTPKVEDTLESDLIEEKVVFSHFKSAKSFFEGDGKQKLKDDLEQPIRQIVAAYTGRCNEEWHAYYSGHLLAWLSEIKEMQQRALEEQAAGRIAALDLRWSPGELREKTEKLRQLL